MSSGDLFQDGEVPTLEKWRRKTVYVGASPPTEDLLEGRLWYDTENNLLKVYDGSSWKVTTPQRTGPPVGVPGGGEYISAQSASASSTRDREDWLDYQVGEEEPSGWTLYIYGGCNTLTHEVTSEDAYEGSKSYKMYRYGTQGDCDFRINLTKAGIQKREEVRAWTNASWGGTERIWTAGVMVVFNLAGGGFKAIYYERIKGITADGIEPRAYYYKDGAWREPDEVIAVHATGWNELVRDVKNDFENRFWMSWDEVETMDVVLVMTERARSASPFAESWLKIYFDLVSIGEDERGPKKAVDGDTNTRWVSDQANSQLKLDYGGVINCDGARIYWSDEAEIRPAYYRLEGSPDGENYSLLHEHTGDPGPGWEEIAWTQTQLRYLKLTADKAGTRVHEIQAHTNVHYHKFVG